MKTCMRFIIILFCVVTIAACSKDSKEPSSGPKINGFMDFSWGDGTNVLKDRSRYDVETVFGSEIYKYNGSTHYMVDYKVYVDYEVYEFVEGRLVSAEVGGNKMDDMKKMRKYLVGKYGQPQESTSGLYEWKSDTGRIALDDSEVYWRLTGWSSDAPSY